MRASPKQLFLVVLFAIASATAVAMPARAQTGATLTSYPACTTTPNKQDSEQAHSAFLLGKRFFDEADYGSAIHNFGDAYKLDCTKTELLPILARAHELNGNRPEAVHALETYVQRAPTLSPEDKVQIQKRIENLKAQIAAQSPAPGAANPAAIATPAPVPVETPAPAPLPLPPPPEAVHSAGPWVVVGVGVVATVTGVIVLALGANKISDAQKKCPTTNAKGDSVCPIGVDSVATKAEDSDGRTLEVVGGIVGGVGLAALVTGIVWHFGERPEAVAARARLEPRVGPGFAGLSLGGTF